MAEAQDVRYAHIAPESSEGGGQSPTNLHVERLGTILLTYGFLDKDLGEQEQEQDRTFSCTNSIIMLQVMSKECRTCVLQYMWSWVLTRN